MCRVSDWRVFQRRCDCRGRGAAANSSLPPPGSACAPPEVGGVVLIIDAKNGRAAQWYAGYGAVAMSNKPLTLVMSLATFGGELMAAGQL